MPLQTSEEILAALVGFDTTSRESNLPLIEWVETYLDSHGIPHLRVDHEAGRKTNLYATIGPDVAGGVVLSGHSDVVPVDGQAWGSDPFLLTERNGLLFGRGAADMKGFLAVCLAMVPHFKATALRVPIHLAFSCDEEVGCVGVVPLVAHIREHLKRPAMVIVGEPTSMQVVNAHKSAVRFGTVVTGSESHSALTDKGVNAIMVAADIIAEISAIREELIATGDPTGRFDPPYSTVHVGVISGGTANNIVPRHCGFSWEQRLLPGVDSDILQKRIEALSQRLEMPMKVIAADSGIRTHRATDVPGLTPEKGSAAEALALYCTGANSTHTASYCTEAGRFQAIGIPTVVCGPGSIKQAHRPDEFIAMAQLRKCEAFMAKLALSCR